MQDVHILVPNRRAILYLKHYLSEISNCPPDLPHFHSIEDFVFETTRLKQCESIDLLFELYAIHRNIADSDARSFNDFIQWGEQLLNDFSDIDYYLVDAQAIFSYLSDAKAVERWHIDGSELTDNEKKYLEFYRSLHSYYALLKEKMQTEQKAWAGLAYRHLYENFDQCFESFAGKPFYIIGFNALTKVEEGIFNKIRRNTPTTFLWDSDEYYVNNPHHEAGHFLRKHPATFGTPVESQQNFKSPKKIVISGCAKNMGQMIAAGTVLSQIPEMTNAPDDTAIVLNDEKLLLPMLSHIPQKYERFNVTMGYPLQYTLPYNFINTWIQLHLSATKSQNAPYSFNKKAAFDLLQHPLLRDYLSFKMSEEALKIFKKNISNSHKKANAYFTLFTIEQDIFTNLSDHFAELRFAFEPLYGSSDFMDKIAKMTALLRSLFLEKEDVINMEFLFYLDSIIARLQEINKHYSDGITIQNLFYIFSRLLKNIKTPFSGEPIGGLQVMGMLETRLLDYKNVILLSVNEDIIPSRKKTSTYIPYDIRLQFSLPTHYDHHAVEAYHFYRLLQRAENIYIFYNTDSGSGVGAKEKSRFISQLLHELPTYNPDIEIVENEESNNITLSTETPLTIPKSPFALKRINEIAQTGFSSSLINEYLHSPIDFYLKYIVAIPETQDFSDGIDARIFGNIIHETIEQTHRHLIGKQLVANDIMPIFERYKSVLEQIFEKNWAGGEYHKGKNLLQFIVAEDYIRSFLEYEKDEIEAANRENLPYSILLQEQKVTAPIKISIGDECKEIMLKGVIDRVVKIGNVFRIIDFKTGNVENRDIKINDTVRFAEEKYSPKAIQLLMYSWLMRASQQVPDTSDLEAGIISFRRLNHGFLPLCISENENVSEDALNLITNILIEILQEILNPDIPFTASDEPDTRLFSPYEMLY